MTDTPHHFAYQEASIVAFGASYAIALYRFTRTEIHPHVPDLERRILIEKFRNQLRRREIVDSFMQIFPVREICKLQMLME